MVVEWTGLGLKTEVVSEGNTGALSCTETNTTRRRCPSPLWAEKTEEASVRVFKIYVNLKKAAVGKS